MWRRPFSRSDLLTFSHVTLGKVESSLSLRQQESYCQTHLILLFLVLESNCWL